MCGITGIFQAQSSDDINLQLLTAMNDSQTHRGPDGQGLHREPGIGLGHRRLSIIDIATGQQPLTNEDGSVIVVYNGEIYNFHQLTRELQECGHQFRTHCDTEVIVHTWEQWGEECVNRFRGMFAFALWDRNRQTLFLARDRLGIKPLYYAELPDDTLIFSSELKALMKHPKLDKTIDPQAVDDYFAYGYIPAPKTIFQKARKLPAGHTLLLTRNQPLQPKPRGYWDVPFRMQPQGDENAIAEELIERLRDAVDMRLVSEVPLGAFLSGGVDSSAVVAMMAGLSDKPVNTCSIAFDDPRYNESDFAQMVADRYHTDHQVGHVDPNDFSLIDTLIDLYDEPYADSSALPTYRVCELARKQVTVALSGDGGDENLGGYRRYLYHTFEERLRSFLPDNIRQPLFGFLGKTYPKADWAPRVFRARSTFEAMARNTVEGYFHGVSVTPDPLRQKLYSTNFHKTLDGYRPVQVLLDHAANAPDHHPLSLIQYIDMKTYLVDDILTKVDRASMAHSLEVRVPLLDHELVEWISGLPADLKLRKREGKYIFKKALQPYLPDDVLYRPKMGFAVPLVHWFKGSLHESVRRTLLSPEVRDSGYFDPNFVVQLLDQHRSGRRDHSAPLWSLLMFAKFLQRIG